MIAPANGDCSLIGAAASGPVNMESDMGHQTKRARGHEARAQHQGGRGVKEGIHTLIVGLSNISIPSREDTLSVSLRPSVWNGWRVSQSSTIHRTTTPMTPCKAMSTLPVQRPLVPRGFRSAHGTRFECRLSVHRPTKSVPTPIRPRPIASPSKPDSHSLAAT